MNKGAIATFKCISTVKWRNHGHNSVSNIMKKIVLQSDKRRPVRFTGHLLGTSSILKNRPEEHIDYKDPSALQTLYATLLEEADSLFVRASYDEDGSYTTLFLFKTEGESIILDERRIYWTTITTTSAGLELPKKSFYSGSKISVYASFEEFLEDSTRNDGTVGFLTHRLMCNIVDSHPEIRDLWVEDID